MRTIEYEGVEIETCPVCEGEWLDADELRQIVQTVERKFTSDQIATVDRLNKKLFRTSGGGRERLRCPKCREQKLVPFNYASSSGVILDKCPACGGIWLDRGELELVHALVEEWNGRLRREGTLGTETAEVIRSTVTVEDSGPGGRSRFQYVLAVLRSFV